MKTNSFFAAAALLAAISCSGFFNNDEGQGSLVIHFSRPDAATRSSAEVPDSSTFLLRVVSDGGNVIYDGTFGNMPETLTVDAGTYTISARSTEFTSPKFDAPQYGDTQSVEVNSGSTVNVELKCRQINAGIRLRIAPEFLTSYPQGVMFVQSEDGRLMYSYSERRIAYFNPGEISVVLNDAGTDHQLFTRVLESREILDVSISAPTVSSSGNIKVSIDTTRSWINEEFTIGSGDDHGRDLSGALSVSEARGLLGATGVWVYGYIIGSASPFQKDSVSPTNLAIAGKTAVTSKDACMSVELKKGAMRDALNVHDNPANLGHKLFVKGDIVKYYSIPGVKNITDYVLQ